MEGFTDFFLTKSGSTAHECVLWLCTYTPPPEARPAPGGYCYMTAPLLVLTSRVANAGGWRSMLCWVMPSWAKLNWDAWHQCTSLSLPSWFLWGSWEQNYLLRSIQGWLCLPGNQYDRLLCPPAPGTGTRPTEPASHGGRHCYWALLAQGMEALSPPCGCCYGSPEDSQSPWVQSDVIWHRRWWESGILKWTCGHQLYWVLSVQWFSCVHFCNFNLPVSPGLPPLRKLIINFLQRKPANTQHVSLFYSTSHS